MNKINQTIRKCWHLIIINTINSWQEDTAYFWNNWGNIISTLSYTATHIFFWYILTAQFHTIAGYSFNELLVFFLFGQIFFYLSYMFTDPSVQLFISDVRKGTLDFILLRPFPSLFYVSFRKIPILMILRESITNTLPYIFFIDWRALHLQPINLTIGILMLIIGLVIWHCVMFLLAFTVFWFGESKQVFYLSQHFNELKNPFESFPQQIRWFFIFVIPSLLVFALPISVILNKVTYRSVYYSLIIMPIFIWLKNRVWKIGLKHYTSAS